MYEEWDTDAGVVTSDESRRSSPRGKRKKLGFVHVKFKTPKQSYKRLPDAHALCFFLGAGDEPLGRLGWAQRKRRRGSPIHETGRASQLAASEMLGLHAALTQLHELPTGRSFI